MVICRATILNIVRFLEICSPQWYFWWSSWNSVPSSIGWSIWCIICNYLDDINDVCGWWRNLGFQQTSVNNQLFKGIFFYIVYVFSAGKDVTLASQSVDDDTSSPSNDSETKGFLDRFGGIITICLMMTTLCGVLLLGYFFRPVLGILTQLFLHDYIFLIQ